MVSKERPVRTRAPSHLLSARGIRVEYGAVTALAGVDFDVEAGEIHALMGENGAGKSTLIKVLGGLIKPQGGHLFLEGAEVRFRNVAEAERAGVSSVFQEVDLQPTMSVAENIALGREETKWGLIRQGAMKKRAQAAVARVGLDLDVGRLASEFPIATQQLIAIARALDVEARVLILDEPTSSLDQQEVEALFEVLRDLRVQGLGLIFITHFLEQVSTIADRITVLRNGERVGTWAKQELSPRQLVEAMTGVTTPTCAAGSTEVGTTRRPEFAVLRATAVVCGDRRRVGPLDLEVHAGEAIGVAGLLGSGRSEFVRGLFGAERRRGGRVEVGGRLLRGDSVPAAISAGVGLCPEDRKAEALIAELTVRENIVLALQARRGITQTLSAREQTLLADGYIGSLRIRTPSSETPVGNLSGGNQQKVVLARWMATQPRILLLDEPTRGIDVGSRAEIERLIGRLQAEGMAIVLVSSELDEIVRVCGRAVVLRDGRQAGLLDGASLTVREIVSMIAEGHASKIGVRHA